MKRVLLKSIVLALQLSIAFPLSGQDTAEQPLVVEIPGGTVELAAGDWKPMQNPESFADNFEAKLKGDSGEFPQEYQVLTVYKLPMSPGDRIGVKVTEQEYVEFFVVSTGYITFQIRLDKGQYWVSSRQSFKADALLDGFAAEYKPSLSNEQNKTLLEILDVEVKKTRYQLQQIFGGGQR